MIKLAISTVKVRKRTYYKQASEVFNKMSMYVMIRVNNLSVLYNVNVFYTMPEII